jgi:hypothetical protein
LILCHVLHINTYHIEANGNVKQKWQLFVDLTNTKAPKFNQQENDGRNK